MTLPLGRHDANLLLIEATASRSGTVIFSGQSSLGSTTSACGASRSHAERGNARPAALRPVCGGGATQSVADRVPTRSVGTRAAFFPVTGLGWAYDGSQAPRAV